MSDVGHFIFSQFSLHVKMAKQIQIRCTACTYALKFRPNKLTAEVDGMEWDFMSLIK